MAERFLITSSFEPIRKGDHFAPSEQLPLHVTIQQYFRLGNPLPFINALQNYAVTQTPFSIEGGERALFGEDEDVPVTRVKQLGRLGSLHASTRLLIARFDGFVEKEKWAGDGFNPHVTDTPTSSLQPGEVLTVRSLELIRSDETGKTVLSYLPFQDAT